MIKPSETVVQLALPDQFDQIFRLRDRLDIGPTIIVFYRGHWCPFCRSYLAKLQQHLPRLTQHNSQLVAISREPTATSRDLAVRLQLQFPLLSDADGKVIDAFGVRSGFKSTHLMNHAAVIVLDAELNLRFSSIDRNYKKRTTIRTILNQLGSVVNSPDHA